MSYPDYPLDSEVIHTPAGDYTCEWWYDENPESPFDSGFTLITEGGRDYIDIRQGDTDGPEAANVVQAIYDRSHSGAAIVRYLRLAEKKGVTLVYSDYTPDDRPSTDRQDRVHGVAWAPDDATDPDHYVRTNLQQWTSWRNGETFRWALLDPSGVEVDSCGGYFGTAWDTDPTSDRMYTLETARGIAQDDALDRIKSANLVGSGFLGLI